MDLIININLDQISARFSDPLLSEELKKALPVEKTTLVEHKTFKFLYFSYNRNSDLRLYFTVLDNFIKQNSDLSFLITGSNLAHVQKHITEFNSVTRLVSNCVNLIDVLLRQLQYIINSQNSLFYTKELIEPASFTNKLLIDSKTSIKNFIDSGLSPSYYILDVRAVCKLYKVNNFKAELVISTRNGELTFYTSLLYLLSKATNPVDLILDNIITEGDNYNVDIRVRDIYGEQCNILPVDIIASSMGKIKHDSDIKDILKSFIFVLVINISNIVGLLVI